MRKRVFSIVLAGLLAGCGKEESTQSPGELLRQGWVHFRLEEFDQADRCFANAIKGLEGKSDAAFASLRINAIYGRGMVASLGRGGEGARQWFEQVIALDPKGEMAAWAALAMVREQDVVKRADAGTLTAGYVRVMEQYDGTAAAEEAFFFRQSLRLEAMTEEEAREAVRELTEHLKDGGRGKIRTALYALLARAHETLKQYPEALAALVASLDAKENDPANPNQNNILEYYRIGMMAQFDVGDFAIARKYYQRFLGEYPRDQRAFSVSILLKHLDATEAALREGRPVPELSKMGGPR